ncbi:MAG: TIGR00269 family protein [Thermoprotei archaeon]|nr:MAG: TIGR00269 family protein [Thermoprotei archaeon]
MSLCDVCRSRSATFYQKHSGLKLCKHCFFADIEERVQAEIRRYNMFESSDKLLLALSGGKDSFVLLDIIVRVHDASKLVALSIIEGIRGYNRPEDVEKLRTITRKYGIDHIVVTIKEVIGYSVDDFVEAQYSMYGMIKISPCTYCGLSRRRILNLYARKIGASRVVTAHNLDDEAQTYLMNLLRGDPARIIQVHPLSPLLSHSFVRRVKPLRKVYEYESTAYAYLKGFRFQETECRYLELRPTLRARIRHYLYSLEDTSPGTLLRFVEFMDLLLEPYVKRQQLPELPRCSVCGEPTSYRREVCKLCELVTMIKNAFRTKSNEQLNPHR